MNFSLVSLEIFYKIIFHCKILYHVVSFYEELSHVLIVYQPKHFIDSCSLVDTKISFTWLYIYIFWVSFIMHKKVCNIFIHSSFLIFCATKTCRTDLLSYKKLLCLKRCFFTHFSYCSLFRLLSALYFSLRSDPFYLSRHGMSFDKQKSWLAICTHIIDYPTCTLYNICCHDL